MIKDMTKTITIDLKELLEREEKDFTELTDEIISNINTRKPNDDVSDIAKALVDIMDCLKARIHLLVELGALTDDEYKKVVNYFKELVSNRIENNYDELIEDIANRHKIDNDGFDWNMGDYVIHIRNHKGKEQAIYYLTFFP